MSSRVGHDQGAPFAAVFIAGNFESGADAFLQIAFAVHPAGDIGQARPAPASNDTAKEHQRKRGKSSIDDPAKRYITNVINARDYQGNDSADQQTVPQTPEGLGKAPPLGSPFQ